MNRTDDYIARLRIEDAIARLRMEIELRRLARIGRRWETAALIALAAVIVLTILYSI